MIIKTDKIEKRKIYEEENNNANGMFNDSINIYNYSINKQSIRRR